MMDHALFLLWLLKGYEPTVFSLTSGVVLLFLTPIFSYPLFLSLIFNCDIPRHIDMWDK